MDLDQIPAGDDIPTVLNAIIEISAGTNLKLEYNKQYGVMELDRILSCPMNYPVAYGYVPSTLAEDGDPLDVLVVLPETVVPGLLVKVRPVGVLLMEDDKGIDHKILSVPICDPRQKDVHSKDHLSQHVLKQIDYFFNEYKVMEGKKSDTYGWEDKKVALKIIQESVDRYKGNE